LFVVSGIRSLPRNVWALSLTSFLRDVGSEMLVHLLPLFLANALGVGTAVIGLIEGAAETIASMVKVYSGWLSDRMGRRKPLTATGYWLSALAMPLLLVAQGWVPVFAYRALDRLGKGIRTAPRDALIADSVSEEQRGSSFGLHRAADTAGAVVGLLAAIAIVWSIQQHDLQLTARAFRAVVAIAIVPAVLAALAVVVLVTDVPAPTGESRHGDGPRSARAALPGFSPRGLGRPLQRFLAVTVLFQLGNSSDAFIALRAQSSGATVIAVLTMIACFNVVYSLLSTPAGTLSDRVGRRRLMVGGWALYAVVYMGFGVSESPLGFWLLYPAYGAYYAMTDGVAKAFVADLAPPDKRGAAYGAYNGAVGLTALPASVIAGVLWQGVGTWAGVGPAAPFAFGAAMSLLAAVLLSRWVR